MLNHLHMVPFFFSMPTPYGLATWFARAGFQVLHIGMFGNEEYMHNLANYPTWWPRWQRYFNQSRIPHIQNDPARPVQTWVLARRID